MLNNSVNQGENLFNQIKQFINTLGGTLFQESDQPNDIQYIVDTLIFTCEDNPKAGKNNYKQLQELFAKVIKQCQPFCSSKFLQAMTAIIRNYPKFFRSNPDKICNIIDASLQIMAKVDFQVQEQWINPQATVCQGDFDIKEEDDYVRDVCDSFNEIASEIGYELMIKLFLPRAQTFISNTNDWRAIYSVLIGMSQLGENIEEPTLVADFIDLGLSSLKNSNPKVRYAALQMFGQLSDDMKPLFQQSYTEIIMPSLLQVLNDPSKRVVSHCLACLTNFFQEYPDVARISKYMGKLMESMTMYSQNEQAPYYIKENVLTTLASLATMPHFFEEQTTIQAIQMIKKGLLEGAPHPIKNNSVQALSFLVTYQDKKYIEKYLSESLNLLMNELKNDQFDAIYIVNAWSRIFRVYKKPIQITTIFPLIFNLAHKLTQIDIEQQKTACQVLSFMAESYGESFIPFFDEVIQFSQQIFKDSSKLQVREQCVVLMISVAKSIKGSAPDPNNHPKILKLFDFFVCRAQQFLMVQNDETQWVEDSYNLVNGFQDLIQCMGVVLTQQNIKIICEKMIQMINIVKERVNKTRKLYQQEQANNSAQSQILCQMYHKNLERLLQAQLLFPDTFQAIIKISSDQLCNWILKRLLPHIQSAFLQQNDKSIHYGLYYLDNFVDSCSFNILRQYWKLFNTQFSKYSLSENCGIRNSAVYGLGALANKSNNIEGNQNQVIQWLSILSKSINLPKKQESKKEYYFARDNIVAAVGKIINRFGVDYKLTNLYWEWLSELPLNNDLTEGNEQQKILINLLKTNPGIIIQEKEHILKILKIYSKFILKRSNRNPSFQQVIKNTRESLILINQWQIFKENSDYLWSSLNDSERYQLTKICQ